MADSQDWQLKHHTLSERIRHMKETGLWSDCEFIVGSTASSPIAAHKIILALTSPVFETMFYGTLPESVLNSTNGSTQVHVPDVQPHIFRMLLDYIYTDDLKFSSEDVCDLYAAANKYMLEDVKQQCMSFMWKNLQPDNVCLIYEFACFFEERALEAHCLLYICQNTLAVLNNKAIEHVQLSTLNTILDQDRLQTNSEITIFKVLNSLAASKRFAAMENSKNYTKSVFIFI